MFTISKTELKNRKKNRLGFNVTGFVVEQVEEISFQQ